METSQSRESRHPLTYIVVYVGVASFGSAFMSPFLAVLLARRGLMAPGGLLHDWFYAIPAELLALGPWNVDLVFPVSVAVYFVQYIVLYTAAVAIMRIAMNWMAYAPRERA